MEETLQEKISRLFRQSMFYILKYAAVRIQGLDFKDTSFNIVSFVIEMIIPTMNRIGNKVKKVSKNAIDKQEMKNWG